MIVPGSNATKELPFTMALVAAAQVAYLAPSTMAAYVSTQTWPRAMLSTSPEPTKATDETVAGAVGASVVTNQMSFATAVSDVSGAPSFTETEKTLVKEPSTSAFLRFTRTRVYVSGVSVTEVKTSLV